jgi:hypothetical protein
MARTDEQAAADEALDVAIGRALASSGALRDGDVVTSWAVIACMQRPDDDGESNYGTCFPRGQIPTHVAVGLFAVGRDLAMNGTYEAEDD